MFGCDPECGVAGDGESVEDAASRGDNLQSPALHFLRRTESPLPIKRQRSRASENPQGHRLQLAIQPASPGKNALFLQLRLGIQTHGVRCLYGALCQIQLQKHRGFWVRLDR
nr:hypothetical protein Iba_chr06eCG10850 [Ipomoea batatas]